MADIDRHSGPQKLRDMLDGIVCAQGGVIIDHGQIIAAKIIDE